MGSLCASASLAAEGRSCHGNPITASNNSFCHFSSSGNLLIVHVLTVPVEVPIHLIAVPSWIPR